jgi:hypothetical protein
MPIAAAFANLRKVVPSILLVCLAPRPISV